MPPLCPRQRAERYFDSAKNENAKLRAEMVLLKSRMIEMEKALEWTAEKPTKPGWYWAQSKNACDSPHPCYISDRAIDEGMLGSIRFDLLNISGPIPEPRTNQEGER